MKKSKIIYFVSAAILGVLALAATVVVSTVASTAVILGTSQLQSVCAVGAGVLLMKGCSTK